MELVKGENKDLVRYEEILLERDALRKQAYITYGLYLKEFGNLLTEVFERKISCIRKKKMISYCQMLQNKGLKIDLQAMHQTIGKEMRAYEKELQKMMEDSDEANHMEWIPAVQVQQIKRIYRKLARQLHPDMNPGVNVFPVLQKLWQRTLIAYRGNNLKELEQLEVLVMRAMKDNHLTIADLEIENVEEKIAEVEDEIAQILSTTPYTYQSLLEDSEAVQNKKQKLEEEKTGIQPL